MCLKIKFGSDWDKTYALETENGSIKSSNIEMYTLTLVITAFYYIGSAEGHEYPILHRLSNNSVSEKKREK